MVPAPDYPPPARLGHGPRALSLRSPRPTALPRMHPSRKRQLRIVATVAAAAIGAFAPPAASASLGGSLDRALRVPGVSRAATAALVFDLDTSAIVYQSRSGLSLRPASNEKLA